MYFGGSIFLIATGAVLKYGVSDTFEQVNLSMIGNILILVGIVAALASAVELAVRQNRTVQVEEHHDDNGRSTRYEYR